MRGDNKNKKKQSERKGMNKYADNNSIVSRDKDETI